MINVPERVKRLYATDSVRKNLRIRFVGGEHADIINSTIADGSFSFNESITSDVDFRFGACESSLLQVECDIERNVVGSVIDAQIEIDVSTLDEKPAGTQYPSDLEYPVYPITLGQFVITECNKKVGTMRRKVVAITQGDLEGSTETVLHLRSGEKRVKLYGLTSFEIAKMGLPVHKHDYVFKHLNAMHATLNVKPDPYRLSYFIYPTSNGGLGKGFKMANGQYVTVNIVTRVATFQVGTMNDLIYVDNNVSNVKEDVLTALRALGIPDSERQYNDAANWARDYSRPLCSISSPDGKSYAEDYSDGYLGCYFDINLSTTSADITAINKNGCWVEITDRIELKIGDEIIGTVYPDKGASNGATIRYYNTGSDQEGAEYGPLPCTTITIPRVLYKKGKTAKKTFYIVDPSLYFAEGSSSSESINMRSLSEGYAELQAQYGGYSRKDGGYMFRTLQQINSLYPDDGRYPSNTVTPAGASKLVSPSMIKSMSYGESLTIPYGKVVCTCQPSDETETVTIEVELFDTDGLSLDSYKVYDLSSNYVIQNYASGYTTDQIEEFCNNVAEGLRALEYNPVTADIVGLPFLEAGDWIEVDTGDGTVVKTLIMERELNGIMSMTDDVRS